MCQSHFVKFLPLFLLLFLIILPLFICHPAPGLVCHGQELGISYHYRYSTNIIINNNDFREPTGFSFDGQATVINVWEDRDNYLLKIVLNKLQYKSRPGAKHKDGAVHTEWTHPLYAHVSDGQLVMFYVHQSDTPTTANVKKSIIQRLLTKQPATKEVK